MRSTCEELERRSGTKWSSPSDCVISFVDRQICTLILATPDTELVAMRNRSYQHALSERRRIHIFPKSLVFYLSRFSTHLWRVNGIDLLWTWMDWLKWFHEYKWVVPWMNIFKERRKKHENVFLSHFVACLFVECHRVFFSAVLQTSALLRLGDLTARL